MNGGEHWVHTKSQISHLKMLLQDELNQTLILDLLISDSKFNGKEKDEFIYLFLRFGNYLSSFSRNLITLAAFLRISSLIAA